MKRKAPAAVDPKVLLAAVGARKAARQYHDGQAVFSQGDRADTVFFVEPDAILFSGDTAMMRLPNITGQTERAQHWLSTLDLLEAMKPKLIVPSHGPMGDTAFITGYRTYLRGI